MAFRELCIDLVRLDIFSDRCSNRHEDSDGF